MATLAPCSAKRTAIAWPMPELPPVTSTFLPFRPRMASVRVLLGAVAMRVSWSGAAAQSHATPGCYAPSPALTAAAAKGTWKRTHHTTTLR